MTDLSNLLSFRSSFRECQCCPIHSNTGGPIPWSGDVNPHYAILGESPSRTDAAKGQLMVGDSGAILRYWLKQVDIDPKKVAFLNSVSCHIDRNPPTPSRFELDNCRLWVHGQLEFIRPQVLITLGVVAFNQIHHPHTQPKLQLLHGKPVWYERLGIFVWSTYHPASYLRGKNKKYEKLITSDLRALRDWDGHALEWCYLCGSELYRYSPDGRGIGLCERHAQHQQALFPEDIGAST